MAPIFMAAHGLAAGAQLHVLCLTQHWQTCVLQEAAVPGQPGSKLNKKGCIERQNEQLFPERGASFWHLTTSCIN